MRALSRRTFLQLAASAASFALLPQPAGLNRPGALPPIFSHGSRDRPEIALTFDDCYLLSVLQDLARLLAAHPGCKASFFPVGTALLSIAERDPDLWPRLYQQGHEIGYHTYRHQWPRDLTTRELVADFDLWQATAAQVVGAPPPVRFARPPYADRCRSFLNLCVERQLVMAMWTADWSSTWGGDPQRGRRRMASVRNGDVVLLHIRSVDLDNVRQALTLPQLPARRLVTLSELYELAAEETDPRQRV